VKDTEHQAFPAAEGLAMKKPGRVEMTGLFIADKLSERG
jgi:hypothetical protein